MIVIFLFIIYSLISFCPVVSPALIKEPRRERTLTKKQTVCQKEIIRIHDIISAKTTVFNKLPCHDSHKESYSVTDTKTNIIYSGSIKRINS